MSEMPSSSAWMWVGKLAPPQIQLDTVRRAALLGRLQGYRHMSLALVTSPPGFGKTTLLAQWREALQSLAQPIPVAWLSLDEADSDPGRFLAYVLLALEGAGVDLQGLSQRAHAQALDANPERTLMALLQALQRAGVRITLMLDDYHRAECPAIDGIVLTLLERASAWLQLIVATRTRPHWPLATLKARGLVHQVDANDLILSLSEASQILGEGMDRTDLAIVHSRTEGWAVAIQLARLWLSRGSGSSHGLKSFSGRVQEVAEYLAEQIVENLPADCREFLLETSLLERFNAELADVARGRKDSAELLARLAPYEALLVPLDAGRSWFRYHLMLADFLRPRLDARRAEQIHRAAAPWLAKQADWVLAVSHALQAHDTELAIALVHEAGGWELVLRKGIQYTQGLLQQFDDLARRSEPELLLMQAYLHAKLGDEALAMELLRLSEIVIQAQDAAQLKRDLVVISALVHVYFDQLDDLERWPTQSADVNQRLPDDPLGQATLLCVGAVAALAWGRMEQAMLAAQAARTRMRLVGSTLGENYCLIHWAQALSATGQILLSRQKIDEALALADANFGTDSSLKALVGCIKAQHLYWQGQWTEVLPWLSAGQETLERVDGWLDIFATTAEISWRIALRQEGLQAALSMLDQSAQLARRRSLARLSRLVQAWRVDLLAQCGLLTQAQQEASAAQLETQLPMASPITSAQGLDWRFLEAGTLALAKLQMAAGAAQPAQVRIERALRVLEASGLQLPVWRLRLLGLLAKRRAQEGEIASAEIQAALAPLLQWGLGGLLLEAGPGVLPLLQQLEGGLPPLGQALITQLRGWQAHPPKRRTHFSAKEEQVLELLVAGQANKAIARAMDISENTVKFHLKQIFQKLNVDSRTAAIAAALQQGFASPAAMLARPRLD
ncbi:LuxR C-terminal-related transcriptional regulator [Paucibacter sp. KBW04]|uniref:LuxR C-terminal-related transcriptional regulator n=1 Tax=Paucibacter sp. KBW04 TaxID=2153361 RepID=UPI0018CC499C|nr:LuxR C-terminal-related transcriptional regulator [Paucibacter sp. KBW04]